VPLVSAAEAAVSSVEASVRPGDESGRDEVAVTIWLKWRSSPVSSLSENWRTKELLSSSGSKSTADVVEVAAVASVVVVVVVAVIEVVEAPTTVVATKDDSEIVERRSWAVDDRAVILTSVPCCCRCDGIFAVGDEIPRPVTTDSLRRQRLLVSLRNTLFF